MLPRTVPRSRHDGEEPDGSSPPPAAENGAEDDRDGDAALEPPVGAGEGVNAQESGGAATTTKARRHPAGERGNGES